jgi:hypothetical protein
MDNVTNVALNRHKLQSFGCRGFTQSPQKLGNARGAKGKVAGAAAAAAERI